MTDENATLVEDASEESTETEVSEDVAGETGESTEEVMRDGFVSDRQKAMDAIIETRRQELEDDSGVTDEQEPSHTPEEDNVRKDSPISFNGEQWVTTVKVDGNEIEVPFDSLKSSHQKDQASQKRFEEAATYARQLKEREHQMHAYAEKLKAAEQQLRARAQPQPPKGAEKSVPSDKDDLVKKYHEALYEDDAAKAAELFNALTNSGRSTATPDINKVVDNALNRAIASRQEQDNQRRQMEYNMALDEAVSWFNTEYDDIASTPELRAIADSKTVTLTQENPDWTPRQVIKEAAEYTRKWLSKNSRPSADARMDRKKKIVKQPRSASASPPSTDGELPPQTATDIIDDMKRARGQL
mgnify:CR=1 FL=1